MPTPEPNTWLAALQLVLKPVTLLLNPLCERIGDWFKPNPKLHIFVRPETAIWCIASRGQEKMMQVMCSADITNDSRDEVVVIVTAYLKGSKPTISSLDDLQMEPEHFYKAQTINMFVNPILGKVGDSYTGRVVLLDQFKREHKTDKVTFAWAGGSESNN